MTTTNSKKKQKLKRFVKEEMKNYIREHSVLTSSIITSCN